ncbi:MAG: baeRF3 domain-containing protein [Rhodanobacter sp.]
MDLLANDYPSVILAERAGPCLSLYQPTHRQRPQNAQDPIRFRNLIKQLSQSLQKKYPQRDIASLLAPLHALAGDSKSWNRTFDGLAVLAAPDFFRVYRLQRPVAELAVVADSFHTKPLLRIVQSTDRYHVLGLNRHGVRLFEGNRDYLDEIILAPEVPRTLDDALDRDIERDRATRTHGPINTGTMGRHGASDVKQDAIRADTEHFFRAVDRSVLEHHTRPTGLPLLLAAMPEHHHLFREVSHNPNLLEGSIDTHPDDLDLDGLRRRAWDQVQPYYLQRLAGFVDRFHAAVPRQQASENLADAASAVIAGRIDVLLLEAERQIPGRMDPRNGEITMGKLDDPQVDDLLDDLGERVMATGGEVVMVPAERMPTQTGLAAIYRF